MDAGAAVKDVLVKHFNPEKIHLEEEDGRVSGYVVSKHFDGVPALERQQQIYGALRDKRSGLSRKHIDQIAIVAALTPAEFRSLDPRPGRAVQRSR